MSGGGGLKWFEQNASGFSGQLLWNEPLSKHTYYRIGGPAGLLAFPKNVDDLEWLRQGLKSSGVPHFVLGAGSNLLVSDSGFPGVVIKMGRLDIEIASLADNRIRTGASVAISTLLRNASQKGWGGLELLTGIPGSVGGAVAMNAGTHLGESKDRLRRVDAFLIEQGGARSYSGAELRFEYRKNLFLPKDAIVISAEWEVEPLDPAKVKQVIDETLARRKSTQPIDYPSCGSVFKNPRDKGLHAWQVIDQVGLRGHRIGDAQIAEKHSNFIINLDRARAADVRALIELAKKRARDQLGVELEEEVKFLGSFG